MAHRGPVNAISSTTNTAIRLAEEPIEGLDHTPLRQETLAENDYAGVQTIWASPFLAARGIFTMYSPPLRAVSSWGASKVLAGLS